MNVVKKPGLTEREKARAGPRVLKEAGSPEWCWQTVDYLKDSLRHVDEQWRESAAVLEELIRAQAWRVIPPEKPYGTLDKMLKAETGLDEQAIKDRIKEARLPRHGEIGHGRRLDNINSTQGGTSETYIVRRLKRDRPDLAQQVLDGTTSARAAGIKAGFVKPYISVRADNPQRLADALRRRLSPEDLATLVRLLSR